MYKARGYTDDILAAARFLLPCRHDTGAIVGLTTHLGWIQVIGDKTKHLVSQSFTRHTTVTLQECDKVFSNVPGIRHNIPYHNAQLLFIRTFSDFICYQSVAKAATNLIQDGVTKVVSKNIDKLVLDIWRRVQGISSSSVKVVFQEGVSSMYPKVEQGPEVAMVGAV